MCDQQREDSCWFRHSRQQNEVCHVSVTENLRFHEGSGQALTSPVGMTPKAAQQWHVSPF